MKNVFKDRTITKKQASAIADSQKDLGKNSKMDMIIALSGQNAEARESAFNDLDELSQMIVIDILSADNLEDAENNLSHSEMQLKQARIAIFFLIEKG